MSFVTCVIKNLSQKEDKSRHIRHMHVTKYTCKEPNCNAKFALDKSLQIHEIAHKKKKDDQLIKCTKCDKMFTFPSLLEGHMSMHSKDRLHKCTSCEKVYKQKLQLSRHLKYCGIDKTLWHQCKYQCGYVYIDLKNYNDHLRTTHSTVAKIPCKKCGKKFCHHSSLAKHKDNC